MPIRRASYGAVLAVVLLASGCERDRSLSQVKGLVDEGRPEEALRVLDKTLPRLRATASLSRAYLLSAESLIQLGRSNDALIACEKAIAASADNFEAQQRAVELLISAGNPSRAGSLADRLLAVKPGDSRLMALKAVSLEAAGDVAAAEGTFRQAWILAPSDPNVVIATADFLLRRGQAQEARSVLQRSANIAGTPEAWLALGRLAEQEGDAGEAELAYRSAVKIADTPETNFRLAQFLQRSARIAEAQVVLRRLDEFNARGLFSADFSMVAGRVGAALFSYVRFLNQSLEKHSDASPETSAAVGRAVEAALQPSPTTSDEMRLRAARALLYQNRHQLDEGIQAQLESEIALAAGDLRMAASRSQIAIGLHPDSAPAHYIRGVALDSLGDLAAAEREWQTAVALDRHVPSRLMLARLALSRGDNGMAEELSAGVVREEPANLHALLIYARALERQRNLDAAAAITKRALAIEPSSAEALVISGSIASRRGAQGTALLEFEKALLLDGRSSEGLEGLLGIFARGPQNRASIAKIERMASALPESATLLEIAGRLYQLAGLDRDAQRALQRSLAVDARRPTAALALWRLGGETARLRGVQRGDAATAPTRDWSAEFAGGGNSIAQYETDIVRGDATGVAVNNLAFAYAQNGRALDRALELAIEAVHLSPDRAEPMDTLGFVMLKMHRYSEAAEAFERALSVPSSPGSRKQILLHLAEAYACSGLTREAAQARGRAAKISG